MFVFLLSQGKNIKNKQLVTDMEHEINSRKSNSDAQSFDECRAFLHYLLSDIQKDFEQDIFQRQRCEQEERDANKQEISHLQEQIELNCKNHNLQLSEYEELLADSQRENGILSERVSTLQDVVERNDFLRVSQQVSLIFSFHSFISFFGS